MRQNLRQFYIGCLESHPTRQEYTVSRQSGYSQHLTLNLFLTLSVMRVYLCSGYLLGRLGAVEGSTSVVSSVWREVCRMLRDKSMVNPSLVEQVLRLGLNKFIKVIQVPLSNFILTFYRCWTRPTPPASPALGWASSPSYTTWWSTSSACPATDTTPSSGASSSGPAARCAQ